MKAERKCDKVLCVSVLKLIDCAACNWQNAHNKNTMTTLIHHHPSRPPPLCRMPTYNTSVTGERRQNGSWEVKTWTVRSCPNRSVSSDLTKVNA